MEVPVELKLLYKHWNKHSQINIRVDQSLENSSLLKEIEYFATERMNIWKKRLFSSK